LRKDYDRNIELNCPTCGETQFEFDEAEPDETRTYKCIRCDSVFTHSQIMDGNAEKIENNVSEIRDEVISEFRKSISKMIKRIR
jgi:uncharacterized Zn finger protein